MCLCPLGGPLSSVIVRFEWLTSGKGRRTRRRTHGPGIGSGCRCPGRKGIAAPASPKGRSGPHDRCKGRGGVGPCHDLGPDRIGTNDDLIIGADLPDTLQRHAIEQRPVFGGVLHPIGPVAPENAQMFPGYAIARIRQNPMHAHTASDLEILPLDGVAQRAAIGPRWQLWRRAFPAGSFRKFWPRRAGRGR